MTDRRINDKPFLDPAAIASEFLAERYAEDASYGQMEQIEEAAK